ncbi:MAG: hypothetical protein N2C14_08290, partial [Planctomycetales bacterium]
MVAIPVMLAGCGGCGGGDGEGGDGTSITDPSVPASRPAKQGDSVLMRAVVNGRETSLYEKVVITSSSATIAAEPGGAGEVIEPWAIFFRLWSDKGAPLATADGVPYVRIGNSQGRPLGWVRQKDVTSWNTRFVVEPLRPVPGRVFKVDLGSGTFAEFKDAVENKRRFALVTDAPDDAGGDELYPVVVYTGAVQSQGNEGTIRQERNKLRDLKLEVVFVVESSPAMKMDYDGVTAVDSVKKIARGWAEKIKQNPELQQGVKLGLVEFQDDTSPYQFTSRVACSLTSDVDQFVGAVEGMRPPDADEDDLWSQDTLAGMNEGL